jgi:hypothetical protein
MMCRMGAIYLARGLSHSRGDFLHGVPDGPGRVTDQPARTLPYSRRGFLCVVTDNYSYRGLNRTPIVVGGTGHRAGTGGRRGCARAYATQLRNQPSSVTTLPNHLKKRGKACAGYLCRMRHGVRHKQQKTCDFVGGGVQ